MTNQRLIENKIRRIVKQVLNESSNPEGDKMVKQFVTKLSKYWGHSDDDVIYFIRQSLKKQYGAE